MCVSQGGKEVRREGEKEGGRERGSDGGMKGETGEGKVGGGRRRMK